MPLWLLLIVSSIVAVLAASVIFGVVDIGYRITPTGSEAPSMDPNPLNLDLGTIPSGSSGIKDFEKVATLNLPVGYEITFTLDLATTGDFSTFDVNINIYEPEVAMASLYLYLQNIEYWNSDSGILDAGTYDVHVKITYTADSVSEETTGTVKIDVSFPG